MQRLIPVETLSEICQAHGEDEVFLSNESLNEDEFEEVDYRFCAVLLRLADILDFDGSRAPEILFPFTDGYSWEISSISRLEICELSCSSVVSEKKLAMSKYMTLN